MRYSKFECFRYAHNKTLTPYHWIESVLLNLMSAPIFTNNANNTSNWIAMEQEAKTTWQSAICNAMASNVTTQQCCQKEWRIWRRGHVGWFCITYNSTNANLLLRAQFKLVLLIISYIKKSLLKHNRYFKRIRYCDNDDNQNNDNMIICMTY